MYQLTEEDYAMKFCMMIIVDGQEPPGQGHYKEAIHYILDAYSSILKAHPSIVLKDKRQRNTGPEYREKVQILSELCKNRKIELLMRGNIEQSSLFFLLVEAIYKTVILVRYYAKEGELLANILEESYCSPHDRTDEIISKDLHISRSTLYRRKQKALAYAGYYFFEAVLPEMAGKI